MIEFAQHQRLWKATALTAMGAGVALALAGLLLSGRESLFWLGMIVFMLGFTLGSALQSERSRR